MEGGEAGEDSSCITKIGVFPICEGAGLGESNGGLRGVTSFGSDGVGAGAGDDKDVDGGSDIDGNGRAEGERENTECRGAGEGEGDGNGDS